MRDPKEKWVTTKEAIRITGYNAEYIRRLLRSGKVNGAKWGREWMIDRESLLAYEQGSERRGARKSLHPE